MGYFNEIRKTIVMCKIEIPRDVPILEDFAHVIIDEFGHHYATAEKELLADFYLYEGIIAVHFNVWERRDETIKIYGNIVDWDQAVERILTRNDAINDGLSESYKQTSLYNITSNSLTSWDSKDPDNGFLKHIQNLFKLDQVRMQQEMTNRN